MCHDATAYRAIKYLLIATMKKAIINVIYCWNQFNLTSSVVCCIFYGHIKERESARSPTSLSPFLILYLFDSREQAYTHTRSSCFRISENTVHQAANIWGHMKMCLIIWHLASQERERGTHSKWRAKLVRLPKRNSVCNWRKANQFFGDFTFLLTKCSKHHLRKPPLEDKPTFFRFLFVNFREVEIKHLKNTAVSPFSRGGGVMLHFLIDFGTEDLVFHDLLIWPKGNRR